MQCVWCIHIYIHTFVIPKTCVNRKNKRILSMTNGKKETIQDYLHLMSLSLSYLHIIDLYLYDTLYNVFNIYIGMLRK